MSYVNIKTFAHEVGGVAVPAAEISVAFAVYAAANKIANARYVINPSDKPMYAKVVETAAEWLTENAKMFPPVVAAS